MSEQFATEEEVFDAERLSKAIDQAEAMRMLMKSPGWAVLAEVVKEDADRLTKETLKPIKDISVVLATEHEKGAAYYARNVLSLPQTLLDAAEDIIEAAKQRETENDDGTQEES